MFPKCLASSHSIKGGDYFLLHVELCQPRISRGFPRFCSHAFHSVLGITLKQKANPKTGSGKRKERTLTCWILSFPPALPMSPSWQSLLFFWSALHNPTVLNLSFSTQSPPLGELKSREPSREKAAGLASLLLGCNRRQCVIADSGGNTGHVFLKQKKKKKSATQGK